MKRPRGRPKGYKLSVISKIKISNSRIGQSHSKETKQKISTSLKQFFKNNPEIKELYRQIVIERFNNPEYKKSILKALQIGRDNYWENYPDPMSIKCNKRIMCRRPIDNQTSLKMFKYWEEHPEIKQIYSDRMKNKQ